MKDKELRLLRGLIALIEEHGIETAELLQSALRTQKLQDLIIELLSDGSTLSRQLRSTKSAKSTKQSITSLLRELRQSDSEKSDLLYRLYESLKAGEIFSTLNELRRFRRQLGIGDFDSNRREQAISRLIRDMAELPSATIRESIESVRASQPNSDRNMDNWSRIILGR